MSNSIPQRPSAGAPSNYIPGEIPPGVYGCRPYRRRVIQSIPCAYRLGSGDLLIVETLVPGLEVITKAPTIMSARNHLVEQLGAWLERSEQQENSGNNQAYLKEDIGRISQYIAPEIASY